MIRIGIITVSDKAWQGKREDKSGELIKEMIGMMDAQVIKHEVVPDEKGDIEGILKMMADELEVDLVLTTGGTGLSPRDVTPEATKAIIDREVPGIAETMRSRGREATPLAILSRAVAGARNKTLIINLPGSPRGVRQSLEAILAVIPHAVEILRGEGGECALRNHNQKGSRPIL